MKYTIKAGDTLWSISERFYGDAKHWKRIFKINYQTLSKAQNHPGRRHLVGPDWIYPNTVIDLVGVVVSE